MLAAQNVGLAGAEAATASALGTGAEVAAGTEALAGVATAMPWLAAGAALGHMLGLFADGGEVDASTMAAMEPDADEPRTDMTPGGAVTGPGGPREDKIPAWLSDGEFVVNAEAVAQPGVKPLLEKINNAGLQQAKGYACGGKVKRA
jgi:uncharacterized protein YidB (DUF937 family)